MIAEIQEDPSLRTEPDAVRKPPPHLSVGHAGRLRLTWRTRWLIFAHLAIFIASQLVDEFVDLIARPLGLVPAQALMLEITIGLVLFLLWGACMLAWIKRPDTHSDRD